MIYQIFPDRFAIGKPNDSSSKLALPAYQRAGIARRRWDDLPTGESDFFGGDVRGIVDRLDYIQGLGATAVYLTPIFTAPSNHKYDTTDYFEIDPQFGDEAVVKELIAELHRRKMKLVLDAVFNHVGEHHPWFAAAKRGERPYRDFFTFDAEGGYDCWWGFGNLPELRLDNEVLQGLLFRNEDSVIQRYLAMGLDHWRFDTALDLGLGIASAIREAVEKRFPDAMLIGETMAFGGEWCGDDKHFHGTMNYYLRDSLLAWLDGGISAKQISTTVKDYVEGCGPSGAKRSWNVLSTHDTPRLKSRLPDAAKRKLAVVAQFTLPGEPLVYYGEENGMDGAADPDCRRPMVWEEARWDQETRAFYKKLAALRAERIELREGAILGLGDRIEGDALAFIRHTGVPNQVSLVVINNGARPLEQRVFLPYSHFYATLPLRDALGSSPPLQVRECSVNLSIAPQSAAVYVPDGRDRKHYTFFKPRSLGPAWP